jgi:ankyrin repeat protein
MLVRYPAMSDPTELVQAAFNGKVGLVIQLLNAGADVNAIGRTWSPLHAAIESQRFTCVAVLLQRGADVSQTILGLSPLAHAVDAAIDQSAQCGIAVVPTDIIRLLISAGAEVPPGLKVARDYGRRDIIELLEAAAAAG